MDGAKPPAELALPRLPLRASIYIDPDGSVHFGALFAELLPIAQALSAPQLDPAESPTGKATAMAPAEAAKDDAAR